jgi:hypothetical protein
MSRKGSAYVSGSHPLRLYLAESLHETLATKLGRRFDQDVEFYVTDLLLRFLHSDNIYTIRDPEGEPLDSVAAMLVEADVRLNANSFDREREVHRHIGDFVLFWAGLFPEYLGTDDHQARLLDHMRQAKFSYYVVSTFDHGDYAHEVPTFRKLSENFETYATGLRLLRSSFRGFGGDVWRRDRAA